MQKNFGVRTEKEILENIIKWRPEIIILQDCGISYFHIKLLKKNLPKTIFIEQNTFSKPSKWVGLLDFSFQMTYWSLWKYIRKSKKRIEKIDILPYPIKTSSFYHDNQKEIILKKIPLEIIGSPYDVAHCVNFIASDESRYITGETIHVNGGLAML